MTGLTMARMRLLTAALLLGTATAALAAGEVRPSFSIRAGEALPKEALKQVKVKAVVAEFLDPDEAGLGKEAGFLLWREILSAIEDQAGAGVILAHPPGKERLTDLLARDYHNAALRVAQSQNARMAVWGAIAEDDGKLLLDTYLSLVGEMPREELALRLQYGRPGSRQDDTGFAARLSRTNFNLPRVVTTRKALFERAVTTRGNDVQVRERPGDGAVVATLGAEVSLWASDMQGDWFHVRLLNGRYGWVNCRNVRVAPPQVQARQAVRLRSGPGAAPAPTGPMAAAGGALPGGTRMTVRASQFIEKSGLWYEVSVGERRGWITAWEVSARYSFPVVHFVAGLYRYQLGRYLDAAREFEQYARADGVEADAASLSSAYQMLAASRMMAASATGELSKDATVREVNLALDQAQKTTPYDPGVFTLRAVTTLATRNSLDAALPHLNRALELDSENTDARRVLLRMNDVYVKPGDPGLQMFQRGIKEQPKVREDIRNLSERYRVAPR